MKMTYLLLISILITVSAGCGRVSEHNDDRSLKASVSLEKADKLGVLWTSGDPDVAHKVCFMYTHAAKKAGWFDQVKLVVWGPSSKLLSEDKSLQEKVKAMIADGIEVKACKACADSYGVSDKLSELGIDVKYMGKPLTEMLKSGWHVITF